MRDNCVLVWSVRVYLELILRADINQSEFAFETMRASYDKLFVPLSPLGHVSYAESADVVLAASGHEHCAEVPEANWATILVKLLIRFVSRVLYYKFHVSFRDARLDAHLVPLPYFIGVATVIRVLSRWHHL